MNQLDPIDTYTKLLVKLKRRIDFGLQARSLAGLPRVVAAEVMAISVRKTCEMIAFSSLATNRHVYSKQWAEYQKHWRLRQVFKNLAKVTSVPYFPRAVSDANRSIVAIDDSDAMTEESLLVAYDQASGVLHTDQSGELAEFDLLEYLSLIHISEPTRLLSISYAVF